jgi:hypothetical protein
MIVRGKALLKSFYLSLASHSIRSGCPSAYEHACYHRFVPVSDTSPAAEAVQLQIYRRMSAGQRLLLGFEISELARELKRAGIRQRHPDWSDAQVERELLRLAFFPQPLPAGLP